MIEVTVLLGSSVRVVAGWLSTGHELAPEDEGGSLSRKHPVLRVREDEGFLLSWKNS